MTRSTNMEHVEVLRELSAKWRKNAEEFGLSRSDGTGGALEDCADELDASIASLSAPQPPARMASIPESSPNGWLQAGGLLYRLTEGHRPQNRDEINVTMVHGSRDPAHCEARAAEILAMLQSQPPAEAQPVAWMRRAARYRGVDGRQEGERIISESKVHDDDLPLYAHPPPSAPVGVEERAKAIAAEFCPRGDYDHGDVIEAIEYALAQQPAAAGEEIMVNAAHDVYTLPLQPSGLSSGPRFVVHVPAPEQPAAVDDLTNAWRAAFVEERATRYREGGMKIEQARIHAETDAARIDALAAQQGGAS